MEQPNYYEITFVLKSVLSETVVADILAKLRNLVTQEGGEIMREEAIGLKEMAYPIKAEYMGIYHLMEFEAQPRVKDLFLDLLNKDDRVMRYMTLRLFKDRTDYDLDQGRSDHDSQPASEQKATT